MPSKPQAPQTKSIVPAGQSQPQRVPPPPNNEKRLSSAASLTINSLLGSHQLDTLSALYDADLHPVKPSGQERPQRHTGKDDAAPTATSSKQGATVQSPVKKVSPIPLMAVQGSITSNINFLSPAINTSTLRKPVPASHHDGNTPSQLPFLLKNPMLKSTNVNLSITSSASIQSTSATQAIQQPSFTAYAPQAPATRNLQQEQISTTSPKINSKPTKSTSSLCCRSSKNNSLSTTIGTRRTPCSYITQNPLPTLKDIRRLYVRAVGETTSNVIQVWEVMFTHAIKRNVLLLAQHKTPGLPEYKQIWAQHLPLQ